MNFTYMSLCKDDGLLTVSTPTVSVPIYFFVATSLLLVLCDRASAL